MNYILLVLSLVSFWLLLLLIYNGVVLYFWGKKIQELAEAFHDDERFWRIYAECKKWEARRFLL